MHMLDEPRTMQQDPRYDEVVSDVKAFLEERLAFAVDEGVPEERVWLDPGIGFGKTLDHNLELLRRLGGTIATNVMAYERGAAVFRVHDVREVADALKVAAATVAGP